MRRQPESHTVRGSLRARLPLADQRSSLKTSGTGRAVAWLLPAGCGKNHTARKIILPNSGAFAPATCSTHRGLGLVPGAGHLLSAGDPHRLFQEPRTERRTSTESRVCLPSSLARSHSVLNPSLAWSELFPCWLLRRPCLVSYSP